jgi:N-acetylglucosamine-6-sulfatase
MSRLLKTLSMLAVLAVLAACAEESQSYGHADKRRTASDATNGGKPNVVFVYTDDQREDDLANMPKTRELVRDAGATFENSYATFPLCCPARATVLSGLYAHNHGIWSNRSGFNEFKDYEDDSVAVTLDEAGYRTALFGKYINGYSNASHVPPGWDEWAALSGEPKAGAEYYNYQLSENGEAVRYGESEEDYLTDVLSDKAEEFIGSSASQDEPFFAYVAPQAPHNPAIPAPRHKGTLEGLSSPRSPSFDVGRETAKRIDLLHQKRAESLLAVDEMVARIAKTLEEAGELDNTYIMFASDNGFMMGEHSIEYGKVVYYEESAGVPLLIRGPGIAPGTFVEELVGNTDFAPTWAELAGTSFQAGDGRSIAPLFDGGEEVWRNQLLLENFSSKNMRYKAIRTADGYKYVEVQDGPDEFHDLDADPHELTNLLREPAPEAEATAAGLSARLDALKRCRGDSCRAAEDAS